MNSGGLGTDAAKPRRLCLFAPLFLFLLVPILARANSTIFHLKNGDRISGRIISEATNQVVITTPWNNKLVIPSAEIELRESQTNHATKTKPAAIAPTLPPKLEAARIIVAKPKPPPKRWKAETRVGADFLNGPKNQQIYYARLKWAYARPYASNPRQFFRNNLDYSADYGWTESPGNGSVVSANRMNGCEKFGFDLDGHRWFTYGLASAGYDQVRKIDLQDEVSGGMGYHLLTTPALTLNVESGLDYQEQYRSDKTTVKKPYMRFSQDAAWKINDDLTWAQKFEFLPRLDSGDFRSRAESTLSYALWHNLSLNLSVLDLYDTRPAQKVTNNDLQVHTSVGFTF